LPPDAVLIAIVCRLYKPRDFETLLTAFARLAATGRNVYLLVVGEGPDRPQVEAFRERLALADRVILTGQRRDIPDILAASDIYTLTTWGWEGLPFTVLEAMAAARPVVATRAGGIPEAVVEEETGLLVPRQDAPALAQALGRLVGDPDLRKRMGRAGRQRAEQFFSQRQMVERTTAVYLRLLVGR
jgi:glycosyltransferase involved in cell wall biosynthesis